MTIKSKLFFILCDFLDRHKQIKGQGLDARDKLIKEIIPEMLQAMKKEGLTKVLMYENRKVDPICWDASAPKEEAAALLCLVRHFEDWQFYHMLKGSEAELKKIDEELEQLIVAETPPEHVLHQQAEDRKHELEKQRIDVKRMVEQYQLYKAAMKGNVKAAEALLYARKQHEYEYWDFMKVMNPLEKKK